MLKEMKESVGDHNRNYLAASEARLTLALVALKKQKLTSSSKAAIDSRPAVLKLALTHFSDEIRVQAFDTLIARYRL